MTAASFAVGYIIGGRVDSRIMTPLTGYAAGWPRALMSVGRPSGAAAQPWRVVLSGPSHFGHAHRRHVQASFTVASHRAWFVLRAQFAHRQRA